MLKGGVGNTGISALGIEPEYARQRCWPNAHTLSTHSTAPTYTGFRNLFFSASHITQCYYVIKDYVAFLQVIMHKTLVLKHFLHYHLFSYNDLFYILHNRSFHWCILIAK